MDITDQLKESSLKLLALEKRLDTERDNLVTHPSNNNSDLSSNSTYFPYLSTIDKYTGFASEYNNELLIFKDLLQKTVTIQKNNSNSLAINNEITSNLCLPTNMLPSPIVDPKIDETYKSNNSSPKSSRNIAASNSNSNSTDTQQTQHVLLSEEKELVLPKIQPVPVPQKRQRIPVKSNATKRTVKAKIINRVHYRYGGKGFDIWKRNGQRPIYSSTELYISKTFGKDLAGIAKLKMFLIKQGGFKATCIRNIKVLTDSVNKTKFGLISISDSPKHITDCMNKINEAAKVDVISFYRRRNVRYYKQQNKTLYVKNIDIVSGKDHKKLTDLFLRFGDLENDIFVNKDRFGNVYSFVQFKYIYDAIECERNQNMNRRHYSPLYFNGKKLQIEYADNAAKNNKNNGKSRNNNLRR